MTDLEEITDDELRAFVLAIEGSWPIEPLELFVEQVADARLQVALFEAVIAGRLRVAWNGGDFVFSVPDA